MPLVRGGVVAVVIMCYIVVSIGIRVVVITAISVGGVFLVSTRHGWRRSVDGSVGVVVLVGVVCVPSQDASSLLCFFSWASPVGVLASIDASIWNILVCCAAASACIILSFAIC